MKVKIGTRTIEIPAERVRGGVDRTRAVVEVQASEKPGAASDSPPSRVWVKPVSNPATALPGWPKRTDKWNFSYAQFLEGEKQAGHITHWWFEAASFWLPGEVRYKPDFMVWYPDGRTIEFVEVKGWSRNLRDGITRYKIAAATFPCFQWKMVKRKGHGWEEYT